MKDSVHKDMPYSARRLQMQHTDWILEARAPSREDP